MNELLLYLALALSSLSLFVSVGAIFYARTVIDAVWCLWAFFKRITGLKS